MRAEGLHSLLPRPFCETFVDFGSSIVIEEEATVTTVIGGSLVFAADVVGKSECRTVSNAGL